MDPISSGSASNPINNPRLDLLHNTGSNQQLNGIAGSYGPTPSVAEAPKAATPAPPPAPPRPAPQPVAPAPVAVPAPAASPVAYPAPAPTGGAPKSAASY